MHDEFKANRLIHPTRNQFTVVVSLAIALPILALVGLWIGTRLPGIDDYASAALASLDESPVSTSNVQVPLQVSATLTPFTPISPTPPPSPIAVPPAGNVQVVPVFAPIDFISDYFTNRTYPIVVEGKPWDYGSVNYVQLAQPGGGTTYWDYWPESEPWDSPNHKWRDDQGNWHTFKTEVIQNPAGKITTFYVLVDRAGPGVMDKLWFTYDAVNVIMGIRAPDPPEVSNWGNLAKLGNLKIQVDERTVFDGPIERWYSGDAQHLTMTLRDILVWRYGQYGAEGNIIPIPYQNHLKISIYGGTGKPKWFMATSITLPQTTRVKLYTGTSDDLPLEKMEQLADNVLHPESYINSLPSQSLSLSTVSGSPARITYAGSGTVGALQFLVPKAYDPKRLWLRVSYGGEVGIDMPLTAFFGEADSLPLHHSTPTGIFNAGYGYLFYTNWPLPFQNGISIELSTDSGTSIQMTAKFVLLPESSNTQLRVIHDKPEKLAALGPDYKVDIPGDGKLVGMVLVTKDVAIAGVPRTFNAAGKEDAGRRVWAMGYLEGNLTMLDGMGNSRYYSGQEDWAEAGYYFDSGYTLPSGGGNRPFAGVLRYRQADDGYGTLFRYFNDLSAFPFKDGLHLTFGHGTWNNNFPVTYGATLFYYHRVPGPGSVVLPASGYATVSATP